MNILYVIKFFTTLAFVACRVGEHSEKPEHHEIHQEKFERLEKHEKSEKHIERRGTSKVAHSKAQGKGNGGVGGAVPVKPPKPLKICGTSFCDSHMFIPNGNNVAYHVPNINANAASVWSSNPVHSGVLTTTLTTGTSRVKYGAFCAQAQKSIYFLGNAIPASVGIKDPSWVAKIPAGDLDILGGLNAGLTYKLDVILDDIISMNAVTNFCKNACKSVVGCTYTSYGWEAPGGWFCKFYGTNICTDTTQIFWKPAPLALSVLTVGGPAPLVIPGFGGCRVTDTIPITTPFLIAGSSIISPITAYTTALPYLTGPLSTTNPIASIKCDVPAGGGLTPGWPTFGTVWL